MKDRFLVGLWLASIVLGFGYLLRYQSQPGSPAQAPPVWPTNSKLELESGRLTLVMFVHPRCPCTRSSLLEVNRLLTASNGDLAARVVISVPPLARSGWEETDLLEYSHSLPDTRVLLDREQQETKLFGVYTSGDVLLYSPEGRLLYSGGVTAARAHEGDSDGRTQILKKVFGSTTFHQGIVFGCPINSPSEFCSHKADSD